MRAPTSNTVSMRGLDGELVKFLLEEPGKVHWEDQPGFEEVVLVSPIPNVELHEH
jgi:hypothetical protein